MTLPDLFSDYTRQLFGEERYRLFEAALNEEAPVSLRLNRSKWGEGEPAGDRVAWCDEGYYLAQRPAFTFDPLLHAGCYYVQEAASMFIGHALRQHLSGIDRPLLAIDLCAAPGGKSTATLAVLPEGSVMVSNEPIRQRAQILAENLAKWGNPRTFVTNNYPHDFLATGLEADVVVCDVPCSGEGMFRKDEGAVGEWSPQNVEKCRLLQREIVSAAWELLKEGGLMAYSTCTFNTKEDEENVRWLCDELGAEPIRTDTDPSWGIASSLWEGYDGPAYRFIPGLTRGEGLFFCLLRKPGKLTSGSEKRKEKREKKKEKRGANDHAECLSWLTQPEAYTAIADGDVLQAIPTDALPVYNKMCGKLRLLKAGIALGQLKGRDIVPSQQLALATTLRRGAFAEAELTYADAIAYLRREPIALPADTPRGYTLLTYRSQPLGFAKNLGPRANNLYPQEWKIKSGHIPEEPKIL